ncbi:hypothetical protein ACFLQ9_01620 [Bacteroidota bacterium]
MLNIGIHAGSGRVDNYINLVKQNVNYKLSGIYDHAKDQKLKKSFRKDTSYDQFLADCDCIIFTNYSKNHYDQLVKAVKESKHIFFDSLEQFEFFETQELMKLSHEANVVFAIGIKNSYFNSIKSSYNYFDNPILVEAKISGINRNKDIILNGSFVEFLFQILNVIRGNIKRVTAKNVSVENEYPDISNINLEFDNGCVVNFSLNRIIRKVKTELSFYKHHSYAIINISKKLIRIKTASRRNAKKIKFLNSATSIKLDLLEMYNAIQNSTSVPFSIDYAVKALEIVNKIREKVRVTSNEM